MTNEKECGRPLWTNGVVVVTERLDVSAAAVRRAVTGKALITVWLEVRSVRTFVLLWRRQTPGFLSYGPEDGSPVKVAAWPVRDGRARLHFPGSGNRERGKGWPHYVNDYTVEVPLFGSPLEPTALAPVEHRLSE